ncbi:EF hand family protein [Histomonas meleagridis]|uniref:EF hand family protein n=1 Tax=Histomonas meleagridis TaxID=135588 RepID=UPI00355A1B82|nr:EF hand family protein [Histomonas meleagridis]KAH0805388.1 EF hand family protein [Histomonas meleagridis]
MESNILRKIQNAITLRKIRLEDVFDTYDRRKIGYVTYAQFQQILTTCEIRLSAKEIQILRDTFSAGADRINSSKFIQAVKNATKLSNKTPLCKSALTELYQKSRMQHVNIEDVFRSYDRYHNGYISENDFIRAFGPSKANEEIIDYFSDNGVIRYSEVINAINDNINSITQPKKMPQTVISAITQIISLGVDLRSLFSQRDRLNIGKVDFGIFTRLMIASGVRMNSRDLEEVAKYYESDNQVNYMQIYIDTNSYYEEHSQEFQRKAPEPVRERSYDLGDLLSEIKNKIQTRKIDLNNYFDPSQPIASRYQFMKTLEQLQLGLSSDEIIFIANSYNAGNNSIDTNKFLSNFRVPMKTQRNDVDHIISKINSFLTSKQTQMYPRFARFDRENLGEFPASLVSAGLQQVGFQLNQFEIEALQQKFPGKNPGFIRWQPLCSQIDPELSDDEEEPITDNQSQQKILPRNVQNVIYKLARYERSLNLILIDELRSNDRTKRGIIPPNQFLYVMNSLFPRLTRGDLQTLISHYGNPDVNYIFLCRDVSSSQPPDEVIVEEEKSKSTEFTEILRNLKAFLVAKMVDPSDIFRQCDPTNSGFIKNDRLSACFNFIRFPIQPNQVKMILDFYQSKVHPERFYYTKLINDLKQLQLSQEEIKEINKIKPNEKEVMDELHNFICEIKTKLSERRRRLGFVFRDCRSDFIEPKEFIERMMNIGFILDKQKLQNLIKYYDNGNGICLSKFIADVESAHLI